MTSAYKKEKSLQRLCLQPLLFSYRISQHRLVSRLLFLGNEKCIHESDYTMKTCCC